MNKNKSFAPRTYREIFSSAGRLAKLNAYRSIYLPMLIYAVIGVITAALSLYYATSYLAVFSFFLLFVLMKVTMDNLCSSHLLTRSDFNLKTCQRSFMRGDYHITTSLFKSALVSFAVTLLASLIILGIGSIFSPSLFEDLRFYLENGKGATDQVVLFVNATDGLMIAAFFLVFLFNIRFNENVVYFSGSQMNVDERYFCYSPLQRRAFVFFFRSFRSSYYRETWFSYLLGALIFIGGFTGGVFAGIAIVDLLPNSDPFFFGAGIGFVAYGLWCGVERLIDATFYHANRDRIYDSLTADQQSSVAMIRGTVKQYFASGTFVPQISEIEAAMGVRDLSPQQIEMVSESYFVAYKEPHCGERTADQTIIDVEAKEVNADEAPLFFGADIDEEPKGGDRE